MSADLSLCPGLPLGDGDAPAFAEPWQAHAFAITLQLHERGVFAWTEWAEALGARIRRAQREGDADLGDTYWHHWLGALEDLVAAKGVSTAAELARYADAWDRAADRTPHGRPIELRPADFASGGEPPAPPR